ncbi:hypothetical protein HPB49_022338 [Dermacentor silvarum]|uniref:Uncharacterized protein n=1 Tax=Dermacentor silvarum TaxID=543639 RepID=A0ACB8CT96_DERSI|nr:hypothetical protein HPB49_022338 [Dermacentor silvarum]
MQAGMLGASSSALVTFEGLRLLRFVRLIGAEMCCHANLPRQQRAGRVSEWATVMTTAPHRSIVCGVDNRTPSPSCTPHCLSCDGDHPTIATDCPKRQRQPFSKTWVKKTLEEEGHTLQSGCSDNPHIKSTSFTQLAK